MTRYELLERIGAGRVAEMFRGKAVAAGGFEKPVAIKRILPHLSQDRRFVELLIAEAKVLSALRHRNIVQIFDVGVGDDGQNFLVMEFVEGVDLGALQRSIEARRVRMPVDLALHVGAEICEALDHAQAAPAPDGRPMRLVHRDVTPSNVMVSRSGEIKLTDFGLAKRPDDGTSTGAGLRGRYGYVSPEQAAGGAVDGRSDVFAVGVIVWELATGRRLFSGLADFDALRAVREDRIALPSEHDPTLPAELDAILAETLARDPRQRLPSAGELGKRLRGLRYSMETSTGDPAAALARLVPAVGQVAAPDPRAPDPRSPARGKAGRRTKPSTGGFEAASEPTIVRIRTADGFGSDPDGSGLLNARKLLDRFEEEETKLSHVVPRNLLDDDPTADGAARGAAAAKAAPPLHLEDTTGERPPLHLDDSDDQHQPADRRARPPAPAPGPASVRRKPAVEPPIPPEPKSERRKPTASSSPPSSPSSSPSSSPPSPPPSSPPTSERRGDASVVPPPVGRSPVAPVFGGSAAGPTASPRPDPTGARGATPTSPQVFGAGGARASSTPPVAGFGAGSRRWWPIVVGAAVIAALSFLITSAALDTPNEATSPRPAPPDAGPSVDGGVSADAGGAADGGRGAKRDR